MQYFYDVFIKKVILEKEAIRKIYFDKRRNLSLNEFQLLSAHLIKNVIQLIKDLKPQTIHCFLPIESKLELDTQPIIDFCWRNNINVVVPVSDFNSNTMKSASFKVDTITEIKKYNIPEPVNPVWVDKKDIDLVITPLLAFDLNGYRVGYGKGFYDRFFNTLNPDVHKVGLSIFEPINEINDKGPYDVPLTNCITPKETYSF